MNYFYLPFLPFLPFLHRELYPTLLKKGDRGKHHNPNAQPFEYGQRPVADGVEGVELLEAYERGEIELNSDGTGHSVFCVLCIFTYFSFLCQCISYR